MAFEIRFEQNARGSENPQRDGQVKPGALLLHVRRSKIYSDILKGKVEAAVLDRRFDALAAFAYRRIRQAYGHEVTVAGRDVDFHVDEIGIDAKDSGTKGFEEHESRQQ